MHERDIFLEALARPGAGEREAYLAAACAGDAGLRIKVEALLAAHDAAGGFLEGRPAGLSATVIRPELAEGPGSVIGPYKLLEKIGEGGFGVVFMAEQERPVKRKVALKVIKPGMDTAQVVARFEAERQALALMDHPNIAKVFDGGATDSGRPYFVMELVRGVPVTDYCDTHGVALRERLSLFADVCRAVQHAHQKGVIHRDLKPSNVLVTLHDGRPVVKVIDFGIAKATGGSLTDRTLFTGFAQLIGTPLYMSPEQAELSGLDVDTRTDVYGLGVLLYELLTGTTPFDRKRLHEAALDEVRRIIREEEPQKPSTRISTLGDRLTGVAAARRAEPGKLGRLVRGDLDWIVMKALEKDRNRRYETANAFARDVERYLADEPVEARSPGPGYRFRKFVRRNKGPFAAAALVLLALVAGAAAATWQAVRATRAEDLAETRYEKEREARRDAEAARKEAVAEKQLAEAAKKDADTQRKAALAERATAEQERKVAQTESARAGAVADFLKRLVGAANPDSSNGTDYSVRELLDAAAADLDGRFPGQPDVEADLRGVIGAAYSRLDLLEKAEPHLKRALELRRESGRRDEAYAASLVGWGWNLARKGRRPEAAEAAREAVAVYKSAGSGPVRRLEALRVLEFSVDGVREVNAAVAAAAAAANELPGGEHAELASILHFQAQRWWEAGDVAAAEGLARRALAMHRRTQPARHPEIGWALWTLGATLFQQGKLAEAEASFREALAVFRAGFGHRTDTRGPLTAFNALAKVLQAQGKAAEADALLRLNEESLADELAKPPATADAALRRGEAYLALQRWHLAVAAFDLAAELVGGDDAPGQLRLANGYGAAAGHLGSSPLPHVEERARAKEIAARERVAALEPTVERREALAAAHVWQGRMFDARGRDAEAAAELSAGLAVFEALGRENPSARRYRQERAYWGRLLAWPLARIGRLDEALARAKASAELDAGLAAEFPRPGEPGVDYADRELADRMTVAGLLAYAGRRDEAAEAIPAGADLRSAPPSHLNDLSWVLASPPGTPAPAAKLAVTLAEAAVAAPAADGKFWNTLGVARYRAGDWAGSAEALSKSAELLGDASFAHNAYFLAMANDRLGRAAEARRWYRRGVEWHEAKAANNAELRGFRAEAEELLGSPAPGRPPVEAKRPPKAGSREFGLSRPRPRTGEAGTAAFYPLPQAGRLTSRTGVE